MYYHDLGWHLFANQYAHYTFLTRTSKKTLNSKHNLYSPYPRQLQAGNLRFSTMYTSSSKKHTLQARDSSFLVDTKEIALFGLQKLLIFTQLPLTETRRLEALLAPLVVLLVKRL